MKILVTGATGFIGSVLTRQLVDQGANVRILRRTHSRLDLLGPAAKQVAHAIGDVTNPASVLEAMQGVQQVYHAAAFLGFGGRKDRRRLHEINVRGTAHVVNAALSQGVERLVHTSSIAAFGRPEEPTSLIDERAVWNEDGANSEYAKTKHLAELEVYRGISEGLDAVIVNPALVFGVGRPRENTREIVERIQAGTIPAIPTGGTNVVDVADVAAAHLQAMRYGKTGERYFLGSENLSWRAIMHTLASALNVRPPRFTLSPAAALAFATLSETVATLTFTRPRITREVARQSARFYQYSNLKAKEELGCTFRSFTETAQRIAKALG